MERGIIYVMTTVVPGLVKIGKTGSTNFEQRMYDLEHNGYRNVTALKRHFAIEVDKYSDKEALLHTIFEKSRVADTELFAIDVDTVTQLLSSFKGDVVFPKDETKEEIFETATDSINSRLIPDGTYTFQKKKKSDSRMVRATVRVKNGRWILLKGSTLGIKEDAGVSKQAKIVRANLPLDLEGKLLADFDLGECSPSHAGAVVLNSSNNGWSDWRNEFGQPVDVYRQRSFEE